MDFTYETVGTTTFLTYMAQKEDLDEFSLKMLEHNEIEGLLPFSSIQENRMRRIRYAITSYETLGSYICRPLSLEKILNILESISKAAIELEEYMLYPDGIILDSSYMYTEIGSGKTRLIYLPLKATGRPDVFAFLKELMGKMQYETPESAVCILKIINEINGGRIAGIEQFLEAVRGAKREKNGSRKQAESKPSSRQKSYEEAPQPTQQPVHSENFSSGLQPGSTLGQREMPQIPVALTPEKEEPENKGKAKIGFFGGGKKPKKEEKKKEEKRKKQKEEGKPITPGFAIPGMEAPPIPVASPPVNQPQAALPIVQKQEPVAGKKGVFSLNLKKKGKETPDLEMLKAQGQKAQEEVSLPVYGSTPLKAAQLSAAGLDFGRTIVEEPDNEVTVVEGCEEQGSKIAYLLRRANGQKMYLEQDVTRIGRESAYVDFYIGDNLRIGRSHAEIIRKGDTYYIKDNHSKNHTYINNRMVTGDEMVALRPGDIIMLANEILEYREN